MISYISILSSILFIISIRSLASPKHALNGNLIGLLGMLFAIFIYIFYFHTYNFFYTSVSIFCGFFIGVLLAKKVKLNSLPQTIAVLNGLGGLSALLVSCSKMIEFSHSYAFDIFGLIVGGITFSGSIIAFFKLQHLLQFQTSYSFKNRLIIYITLTSLIIFSTYLYNSYNIFFLILLILFSLFFGVLFTLPVGGADMPVVISILNSMSGWACVFIGFATKNQLLIIVGSLVGFSGLILSLIMSKSSNRSILNILSGKIHSTNFKEISSANQTVKTTSAPEAAYLMENAANIIIVPGYGVAASGGAIALKELADKLEQLKINVKFAIHPVAGRMPGHMNVLLAEAGIDYKDIFSLEDINFEFSNCDVAYVVGANDITNPLALKDKNSPIFGMPVLQVWQSKTVIFVKRSLSYGYSKIDNPLFYEPNTLMLYGDAKLITQEIIKILEKTI